MVLKVLIIADQRKNHRMLTWGIASDSCQVHAASTREEVRDLLEQQSFHVASVDTRMTDDEPLAVVALLRRSVPRLPIIALLADRERALVNRLNEHGVRVHLTAPYSIETFRSVLRTEALQDPVGAAASSRLPAAAPLPAPAATPSPVGFKNSLVARDDAARKMLEIAFRAATSNVSILILGETGTGKNLLAQTIHEQSAVRDKPFITVSCPSLSQELLESDLFGHVRGAFTGAVQDTWGKVAAAEGGTLFLDEIGDLPAALQPKLLRLLQEKQYERVGETVSRNANVRIIAATNRDLKAEVAAGRFREDLFYRLNVITLEVPALRCRPSDVMAAAEVFLESVCKQLGKRCPTFTPETRRLLEGHAWPGNLRELRNVIERAAVLSDAATLGLDDFPSLVSQPTVPQYRVGAAISLRALEAAHIQMVIANTPTLEEAARILEIDKSTLYRKRKAMEARLEKFAPTEADVLAAGE